MTLTSSIGSANARTPRAADSPNAPIIRILLDGGLGGLVGTGAMSAVMLAARKMGLMGRLPPERITQRAFFRGRRQTRQREKNALAAALHVSFGGATGLVFGPASSRMLGHRTPLAYAGLGTLYGTLIWVVSYVGWAPALGLMPPAHRDRPDRPMIMVVAHWVFGATLGTFVGVLGQRGR